MMSLKKTLRNSGYDLIDSPIRNHKLLQLWKKYLGNPPVDLYRNVSHAFTSPVALEIYEDSALSINHSNKENYKFNIGITVLDKLLTSLGLGNLNLSVNLKGGKGVSISYGNSKLHSVSIGELESYFSTGDFSHPNEQLLKHANDNRILIINSILTAQNYKAIIESESTWNTELEASLNELADGKIIFERISKSKLEMTSIGNDYIPVGVQAHRLDWDNGEFDKMNLITNTRNIF